MDIILTPTHLRIAFAMGAFFGGCIGYLIGVLHEWTHPSPTGYDRITPMIEAWMKIL